MIGYCFDWRSLGRETGVGIILAGTTIGVPVVLIVLLFVVNIVGDVLCSSWEIGSIVGTTLGGGTGLDGESRS